MVDSRTAQYVASAPNVAVDKESLAELAGLVHGKSGLVLLGFNDYAKHLINLHADAIVAVVDYRYSGFTFRGVPVLSTDDELPEYKGLVVTDYGNFLSYKRRFYPAVLQHKLEFLFPSRFGAQTTKIVDHLHLDPVYKAIWDERSVAPSTMMSDGGMFFILEALRSCMVLEGDVAEVGAWQGGSAWHIAKFLEKSTSDKQLHVFDTGELLGANNPQGIVCEGQMRQDLAFYPHTVFNFGPASGSLERLVHEKRKLCFIFLDFGYSEPVLSSCYELLVTGGILLMDNYGHARGHPDMFDSFLESRGTTAIRMHKSAVAFAIKR